MGYNNSLGKIAPHTPVHAQATKIGDKDKLSEAFCALKGALCLLWEINPQAADHREDVGADGEAVRHTD